MLPLEPRALRVLIVEDSERDADLLLRELRRCGFNPHFERVDTADRLKAALADDIWDIVLSDWQMPRLDATAALALVKELAPDLPFIIVSGTIGEETAVSAMRAGAHDFMSKNKLTRLLPTIERELAEAASRAEHRHLKEQLLISDRMVSLGTLAAGVAHEINNPLAALMADLDFATRSLASVKEQALGQWRDDFRAVLMQRIDEVAEPLKDAKEVAERIRLIVRDLKVFARAGDTERHDAVNVQHVIDSALRIAWTETSHRARLVKDYAAVPPARGTESGLGQVFLNLIINAAQAIPEGHAESNEIRIRTRVAPGDRVLVEVQDTGTGILPEHLPRIFDALFTTKPVGVGTGLGLAVCHRIVTSSGGEIRVESELGVGTTFRVLLPVATQPQRAIPAVDRLVAAPPRRGRIMVVEDDAMVRSALEHMLSEEYDILAVGTAREALERLTAGERFDLVLCDLMMPDVTGMELHAQLSDAASDATARMVFMTGGAFTPAARDFLDRVPNSYLEKPFDAEDVRAALQRVQAKAG